jgi:RpiR family transcriptional regulator, carbohydrate utilization regulator
VPAAYSPRIPARNEGKFMARRQKEASGTRRQISDAQVHTTRYLLTHMKGVLASLNPTERLIAECVLADPEKVITSSIAELSEACGASVGAIVGFCRRLGLKGFADFKIALARDLAQSGLPAGQAQQSGSLLEKVFHFHAQSLTETLRINPTPNFERVAQALGKARRIELFSIGLSYPVAYTSYCKFTLLGLQASAQFDSHIQLINATQLKAGDVAFGISCSGSTRETVECLEVAHAKGATTICLTNAMNSPITTHSDLCLYATPSEIKYFQAPLASRVTQLAVIDALFVSLASKHKNKTAERLQQSGEELLKRRWA